MSVGPGSPIFAALYWLMNTPGIGGLAVMGLVGTCVATCGLALRWIAAGAAVDDPVTYPYPTSALFHHPDGTDQAQGGKKTW